MATTINWGTGVISVPRADMPIVQASPERRALDLSAWREELIALTATEAGIPFPDTHVHNTEVTLSGVTYARFIEIINDYTVEFEAGLYGVIGNGANTNILDVIVDNGVHYLGNNAAGLIVTDTSGLTGEEADALALVLKLLRNRREQDPSDGSVTVYDDDSTTPLVSGVAYEDIAGTQTYQGNGADRIDRLA